MEILSVTFRLRAPWCESLKDKRSVVKGLAAGLRNKFNVSVCESGDQDLREYIELSVAALVSSRAQGDSIAENIEAYITGATDAELYGVQKEYR